MKTTRKYGKTERKIVKVHWTPSESNVKEREGCETAVVNLGTPGEIKRQRVEFDKAKGNKSRLCGEDVDWTLGGQSKDGKMQLKDEGCTCGNKGRTQCVLAKLSALFAETNLIQSTPQGMGCHEIRDENGQLPIVIRDKRRCQEEMGDEENEWATRKPVEDGASEDEESWDGESEDEERVIERKKCQRVLNRMKNFKSITAKYQGESVGEARLHVPVQLQIKSPSII
ncbi:hypothetical protein IW261DRAFT_1428309 [Armillaria novae-zelandiae]|uniref:Uncharacterized protein n=1 Tax=Armillaria novae-zelandiae TaxID=153914 RepID=A0AA39N9L4_9AGAR|nr:hypothetical protein IW261DRAFT_1428309 [Armillaria novae-zelandiae]